jgi:hypothetical protein
MQTEQSERLRTGKSWDDGDDADAAAGMIGGTHGTAAWGRRTWTARAFRTVPRQIGTTHKASTRPGNAIRPPPPPPPPPLSRVPAWLGHSLALTAADRGGDRPSAAPLASHSGRPSLWAVACWIGPRPLLTALAPNATAPRCHPPGPPLVFRGALGLHHPTPPHLCFAPLALGARRRCVALRCVSRHCLAKLSPLHSSLHLHSSPSALLLLSYMSDMSKVRLDHSLLALLGWHWFCVQALRWFFL